MAEEAEKKEQAPREKRRIVVPLKKKAPEGKLGGKDKKADEKLDNKLQNAKDPKRKPMTEEEKNYRALKWAENSVKRKIKERDEQSEGVNRISIPRGSSIKYTWSPSKESFQKGVLDLALESDGRKQKFQVPVTTQYSRFLREQLLPWAGDTQIDYDVRIPENYVARKSGQINPDTGEREADDLGMAGSMFMPAFKSGDFSRTPFPYYAGLLKYPEYSKMLKYGYDASLPMSTLNSVRNRYDMYSQYHTDPVAYMKDWNDLVDAAFAKGMPLQEYLGYLDDERLKEVLAQRQKEGKKNPFEDLDEFNARRTDAIISRITKSLTQAGDDKERERLAKLLDFVQEAREKGQYVYEDDDGRVVVKASKNEGRTDVIKSGEAGTQGQLNTLTKKQDRPNFWQRNFDDEEGRKAFMQKLSDVRMQRQKDKQSAAYVDTLSPYEKARALESQKVVMQNHGMGAELQDVNAQIAANQRLKNNWKGFAQNVEKRLGIPRETVKQLVPKNEFEKHYHPDADRPYDIEELLAAYKDAFDIAQTQVNLNEALKGRLM